MVVAIRRTSPAVRRSRDTVQYADLTVLPADTRMGPVTLSVADLGRSLSFYEQALGLVPVDPAAGGRAALGPRGGAELLILEERPGAAPAPGHAGLFHFALLVPDRADLARWFSYAVSERLPLTGLSDHFVSEAIYMRDPDHHGIEIYADRPRELWEGRVQRMGTWPLDTADLLRAAPVGTNAPFEGLSAATVMGHVHLCVADVTATTTFYRDLVGFEVMAELGPQAAFFAAGGYHHHLAGNTWESAGAPRAPETTARLELATIVLGDAASRDALADRLADAGAGPVAVETGVRVSDPSGIPLELRVAA